jgi:hypothetical protein
MPAKRLTHAGIVRLKATTERLEVRDGATPGLFLVVEPNTSHKAFALRGKFHGRGFKLVLGPFDASGIEPKESRRSTRWARR